MTIKFMGETCMSLWNIIYLDKSQNHFTNRNNCGPRFYATLAGEDLASTL